MTNVKLVIIGAGGHGRVARDIANICNKYTEIIFLDDSSNPETHVAGKTDDYIKYLYGNEFFVAIGNNDIRKSIMNNMVQSGAQIATLIHPNATVAGDANIGPGTIIMAGAVVNSGSKIGKGSIINTCSSVDHDCSIGDFTHVSVGAHIAGTVMIGERTFVGAGATVINNVHVCDNCIIGAGGVVINDITEMGTYVGVPVKKIKD